MVNNYYKLYVESIYSLAKTMAVKLEDVAVAMNAGVMTNYPAHPIDVDNPVTWKYYRNIAGLYHTTDTPMSVVSLDDLTDIDFSKDTLRSHPITKQAYAYSSNYYRDLINRYPQQELLILGILYAPDEVDFIDRAVAAQDGAILYYASQYVEITEPELMTRLQKWTYTYCKKWINRGYAITDNLYAALECAQLSLHLVPAIINIRLALCKTSQVHSYHIKQFLASNGQLDIYLDKLTRSQALFLYRNLAYIRNNVGRSDVFDWVVDNILTERGLPLYAYSVKHNTYVQLPDDQNPDRLSYVPEVVMKRRAVNFDDSHQLQLDKSLQQTQLQLDQAVSGNQLVRIHRDTNLEQAFQLAKSNVTLTKIAESVAVDWSDNAPYTLTAMLFSQWMAWAYDNKYAATMSLQINGQQTITPMSVRDVAVLYNYCISRAAGFTSDQIAPVIMEHCYRRTPPTPQEIASHAFSHHLSQSDTALISSQLAAVPNIYNVSTFFQQVDSLYSGMMRQYRLYSYWNQVDRSTAGELLGILHFEDRVLDFIPQGSYTQWLSERTLDVNDLSGEQYLELATSLFDQVTGYSLYKNVTIKDVQRAMLAVLSKLSAYSTLYLSDVNNLPVSSSKNKLIKIYGHPSIDSAVDVVRVPVRDLEDIRTSAADAQMLELEKTVPWYIQSSDVGSISDYQHRSGYKCEDFFMDSQVVANRTKVIWSCDDDILAQFNTLTKEQKRSLGAIY